MKVVALGGSVTKGHGPLNITNSWVNRVFSWMNETFPHPDHVLSNQAIPAVCFCHARGSQGGWICLYRNS